MYPDQNPNSHVWHLFSVRASKRDELQKYLESNEIQTAIHYPVAPHKQIAYKELCKLQFPISEKIHNEILSLPISPIMQKKDLEFIAKIINKW